MARKGYNNEIAQNIDLPADLVEALDVFCEKRGVKKKNVAEMALRRYLAQEAGRAGR